jgi:hypothetical protein
VRRAALGLAVAVLAAGSASGADAYVFRVAIGAPRGHTIPRDFLGLALEYRSIPAYTGTDARTLNPVLAQLIRNLAPGGRPVLRVGGQSTDRTWWPVAGQRRPLGVTYDLTSRWTAAMRTLAQATNAKLILSVGLEANRPRLDQVEADELLRGIGRRYLDALEIGNEPELYTITPWYVELGGRPAPWYSHVGTPVFARGPGYDPRAFLDDFDRALRALPNVPVAGPDTGLISWLGGFRSAMTRSSRVRIVTWHAYGLNQCVLDPTSPLYPTVSNLLTRLASRAIVNRISPYVRAAHAAGESFRIDEMNSVTCNGRTGVSDSFASALWAMDALFAIASDGVDGVNIHTFQGAANGLFDFDRAHGSWEAAVHPLYYGVLAFAQAAPPGSRLLRVAGGGGADGRAWATLGSDHRVRVLLINDSPFSSALAVVRTGGGSAPATVERLRAAGGGAYATGGVTLGGQSFGSRTQTGRLPAPVPQSVTPRGGTYRVTLPAAAAALLTVPPGG